MSAPNPLNSPPPPNPAASPANPQFTGLPDESTDFESRRRRFEYWGMLACVLFVAILVAAATVMRIGGAVTAPGFIQQTGENKAVQHPEGGAVKAILVQDGDLVNKGDTLVRLSGSSIESQHRILAARQFELAARLARLDAQNADAQEFDYPIPESLPEPLKEASFAAETVVTQQAVFRAHRHRLVTARERIDSRIRGLELELIAQEQQIRTTSRQIALLDTEIAEVSELLSQQLVSKARLTALQRQRVGVEASVDGLKLSQARTRNALSDSRHELNVLNREDKERLWREIELAKTEAEEVERQLEAASDRLARLVITSPATGRVHELSVHNTNAVIGPRETIAEIVPADAGPILSARVGPLDIDQVTLGQVVRVRFDTLDMRDTPEIEGRVVRISPDTSMDNVTGEIYYAVLVELPSDELARVEVERIIPGLPASALFSTGERTMLDYITKPIRDQMFSAFRED